MHFIFDALCNGNKKDVDTLYERKITEKTHMQAGRQQERKKKKKGLGMRGMSKLLHGEQLGREKSATEKRNGAHIILLM